MWETADGDSKSVDERRIPKERDACREGEWSFTCRPLLHVNHTWVLERRALLGSEWKLLTSRRFGSAQDPDVTWTICLEVDTSARGDYGYYDDVVLRLAESARVCIAFGTESSQKCVFFGAELRAQQEAVQVVETEVAKRLLDAANQCNIGGCDRDVLFSMIRATPNQRMHIGDLVIIPSDATLTVRVDIAYFSETQEARAGPPSVSLRVPPCSLAADMETLLKDGILADAVLVADGREWPVHKAVLGARSPVFAAMFRNDMAESKDNRVTVKGVDGDVMHQVLRYMYTGRVDHIRSLGEDMLAVADRYELPRLKALCEETLANSVSIDNALGVLALADVYGAKELLEAALQCVSSNIHKILPLAAWRDLVESKPHLLHLVLAKCVNYRPHE